MPEVHMNKRGIKRNLYRFPLQWIVFVLLAYVLLRPLVDANYAQDFETYCPLGGLQAFGSLLVNNSLACNMTETQIFLGIALLIGVIVFSKLFCSYLCPIGTFTEWLGRIGERWKVRYTITGIADRLLRVFKYALLFATFYFTIQASELFCRKFDPYYAVFTGFSADVVLLYALPALIITVAGSIFLRQFWCKYVCPLSAASNIFMNAGIAVGMIALWIVIRWLGLNVPWEWPFLAICATGFLVESLCMRSWIVPGLRITRREDKCTGCRLCDKACPMAIKVSEMKRIDHIDCHLCGDCVAVCKEPETLGINNRNLRWLPAAATVVLVIAGLIFASHVELPTIDMRWGSPDQLESASLYEQDGLKSIKCFGSSSSFATRMREVPGILGVRTYVKTHSVKILYDPTIITPEEIRRHIFSPVVQEFSIPSDDASVAILELGVDRLFDTEDMNILSGKLELLQGLFMVETGYGEPVKVTVYYDPAIVSAGRIKGAIEQASAPSPGAESMPGFPVRYANEHSERITGLDLRKHMFVPDNTTCNNYASYPKQELDILTLAFPDALDAEKAERIPELISHLSNDSGVVRVETRFTREVPEICIYYVRKKTGADAIMMALSKQRLTITYESGATEDVDNPFVFSTR
jgi:polyferredoxin